MMLTIPAYAAKVIAVLEKHGHEAYVVGGCVRDAMLRREPGDWDVTTSALPNETLQLFSSLDGFSAIPTGIAHGTVTVLSEGKPVEVTTYRVDGEYSDSRRPDSVEFCKNLSEDLARRDFTVNAMAYSEKRGLVDLHGGAEDLAKGIIRCVGDPVCRFTEDALRILRAVRFSAVLDFRIEPCTAEAVHSLKTTLIHVSRERVGAELGKLLYGPGAASIIRDFADVFAEILPGIVITETVVNSASRLYGEELPLMLAAIHGDTPHEAVKPMLRSCRFDNKTVSRAEAVSRNRDAVLDCKTAVKRLCRSIGTEAAEDVIKLRMSRGETDDAAIKWLNEIKDNNECVSIKELAVDGEVILSLGVPPESIGRTLDALLDGVIDGGLTNERETLVLAVKRLKI